MKGISIKRRNLVIHETLVSTFWDHKVERQDEQYPSTIIILKGEQRNIEVIYLKDVILVQENGEDHKGGRNFIWRETESLNYLIKIVNQMIHN